MVGRVCLVGPETLQKMRLSENLPRLPALKMCGGGGVAVDDGAGGWWGPDRPRPMATKTCAGAAAQNLQLPA